MTHNRKFERVDCRTEALITYDDKSIKGEVENLSLKGFFVKTDQKIELNQPVGITVYFNSESGQMSFSVQGNVVRVTDDGIGVNYQKIDLDSLVHTMNCPTTVSEKELCDFCSSIPNENGGDEKLSA